MYNQDVKFDGDKLMYELIPVEPIEELAKIFTYGAKKYKPNSWQNVEPFDDRYYAAAMRHLLEWRKGNQIDEESKHRHLSHCLWNIAVLLTNEIQHNNAENKNNETKGSQPDGKIINDSEKGKVK